MVKSDKKRGPKVATKKVILSACVLPSTKTALEDYAFSITRSASYVTEQAVLKYLQNNS